jgi:hypothetical protein
MATLKLNIERVARQFVFTELNYLTADAIDRYLTEQGQRKNRV